MSHAAVLQIVKIGISQRKIIRFRCSLPHKCRFRTWWQSHDQIWKFLKFKVADGRHLENQRVCSLYTADIIKLGYKHFD